MRHGCQSRVVYEKGCSLCVVAREIVLRLRKEIPFEFQEVDIESRGDLYERFREEVPVVFVNGERTFTRRVSERKLKRVLKRRRPK